MRDDIKDNILVGFCNLLLVLFAFSVTLGIMWCVDEYIKETAREAYQQMIKEERQNK